MAVAVRYRRLAKARRSVASHGGDEFGDLLGFAALVELSGHLTESTGPAFGDRAQHERLAPRGGWDVVADPNVQVRPDAPDRLHRGERVADRARAGEEVSTALLGGVQVQAP